MYQVLMIYLPFINKSIYWGFCIKYLTIYLLLQNSIQKVILHFSFLFIISKLIIYILKFHFLRNFTNLFVIIQHLFILIQLTKYFKYAKWATNPKVNVIIKFTFKSITNQHLEHLNLEEKFHLLLFLYLLQFMKK